MHFLKLRLGTMFVSLMLSVFAQPLLAAPNFPPLNGRVVDQAQLIDVDTKSYITTKLQQHEEKTSNQIVVVTLASLEGYDISEYGYQLGRYWGIGQKNLNNGALLIVAPNEKKVRIEVGYGLEGVLTDAFAQHIISQNILPAFRQGDFQQGIRAGVDSMIEVLELDPVEREDKKNNFKSNKSLNDFFGFFAFIFFFLGSFLRPVVKRLGRVALIVISLIVAGLTWWLTAQIILAVFAFVFSIVLLSASTALPFSNGSYRNRGGGSFGGGGGRFGGGGASGGW